MKTSEVPKNAARVAISVAAFFIFAFFADAHAAARFEACDPAKKSAYESHPSDPPTTVPSPTQSCPRIDDIALLKTTGLAVTTSLDSTLQTLKDGIGLQTDLEKTVLAHLESAFEKYDHLAKCTSKCFEEITPLLAKLTPDISRLRVEMSLMQPDEVGSNTTESTRGWFSERPKHPFSKSPSVPRISAEEREAIRREFLNRLAEKLPFVASRLKTVIAGTSLLAETPGERSQVAQAVIQIQQAARKNYLRAIGADPLLIFLDQNHPELPTTARDLNNASQRLANEIAAEKKRLQDLPASPERFEAFIEYQPLVESTLKKHPEYCTVAARVADAGDARRSRQKVGLILGQVAAGFATTALCSTVISCGVAAAVLSGADIGIASLDAKAAFRSGLGAIVTSTGHHDTSELMANADSAARLQVATLALGAPTILKSSGELVQASGALLRSSFKSAEAAATKTGLKSTITSPELAGAGSGVRNASTNPIWTAVYADLFKDHSGREKEIIEELIRRYEAKGLNPVDISATVKQRVHQCAH